MADINLKTLTPDSSLPTTGFLFGADSQATASPSVYSMQTVATTLLGSTSLTGDTLTASAPVLNLTQTWNNAATTFTALKVDVTDTASNASSLLMDLQVGGVSRFSVDKVGNILTAGQGRTIGNASTKIAIGGGNIYPDGTFGSAITLGTSFVPWGSLFLGTSSFSAQLSAKAAANLRFGAADAASPIAQTLSVQSVVAGTTNTAGADLTITGAQGTGTGVGGSIVFQVATPGSSGTAQNALATALTIAGSGASTFTNSRNTNVLNVTQPVSVGNGVVVGVSTHNGPNVFIVRNDSGVNNLSSVGAASTWVSSLSVGATAATPFNFLTSGGISFSSGSSADIWIGRDAANTLAQRNGVNAQTFRLYNTFTDASNYERLTMYLSAGVAYIGTENAGTGAAQVLRLNGNGGAIYFQTGGVDRWSVGPANHFTASADNAYDIGNASSNRPRYIRAASAIVTAAKTVATLPAAATAGAGARSFVTDATMSMTLGVGSTVAGGGANAVPVYSDGTNWLIG